mmetsp:Transcript_81874/g.231741  ORF Transcript_81874/g.231741 Transcript_81874/m.231741 type:complete len:587 (-) Transcript_81874:97-1857(-)
MEMVQWVKVPGERPYFWNPHTQATSWTEPQGEEVVWVVQQTAGGDLYYWNKETDETSREPPSGPPRRRGKAAMVAQRQRGAACGGAENDPGYANVMESGEQARRKAPGHVGSTRLTWRAQQTAEGLIYKPSAEVDPVLPNLVTEPLASWPFMESREMVAAAESMPIGKIEPGPMMVIHALKQNSPAGHMVSFADGRMMMKLPACSGGATLVPMRGSAAELKALFKAKMAGEMVEPADNLESRYAVKRTGDSMVCSKGSRVLAQSRMWDINRLHELNCEFIDSSGYQKNSPLNLTSLQMELIHTYDGASASLLPGCLKDRLPFSSAVEQPGPFEYSSIEAAASRLRSLRGRGLVAASLKMATSALAYSWTPGVVASDWTPYLRPKTLQAFKGARPLAGAQPSLPWWQQAGAAAGAPPGAGGLGPAPAMAGAGGKAMSTAMNQATLLQSVRGAVLDILGTELIEDDTSLMHAGVTSIKALPLSGSLQALLPEYVGIFPEHQHDLATGFEPPAPKAEGALAAAGERAGAGESEKGCRATATRIRSSASSFYTLMGSSAADYTTMALNLPQGGPGRGPGLSAQPFTAALS